MTMYAIEAIDPLVFRDGRPNDRRSESRTMRFPMPSVLAGVARTAIGRQAGGIFDDALVGALRTRVATRGPLLRGEGRWYAPAPADAVLFASVDEATRLQRYSIRALGPTRAAPGTVTSSIGEGRHLVGFLDGNTPPAKPASKVPAFWGWDAFETWLRSPRALGADATHALLADAIDDLDREERVHVAIGATGTAEDRMLFATEGLRSTAPYFLPRPPAARGGGRDGHAVVTLHVDIDIEPGTPGLEAPRDGARPMGGERRLARWTTSDARLPALPAWLVDHALAGATSVVRVVLLTPAYVATSAGPRSLDVEGQRAVLAARVDRPLTISGWDLTKPRGGEPKRTRRLAPAGSVYWVRLSGSAEDRRRWLDEVWMRNIGDDDDLRDEGFGLAAIGTGSEP